MNLVVHNRKNTVVLKSKEKKNYFFGRSTTLRVKKFKAPPTNQDCGTSKGSFTSNSILFTWQYDLLPGQQGLSGNHSESLLYQSHGDLCCGPQDWGHQGKALFKKTRLIPRGLQINGNVLWQKPLQLFTISACSGKNRKTNGAKKRSKILERLCKYSEQDMQLYEYRFVKINYLNYFYW